MRDTFPPSTTPAHRVKPRPARVRLASELYIRAYWRVYLFTAIWVCSVAILFPIR